MLTNLKDSSVKDLEKMKRELEKKDVLIEGKDKEIADM